MNKAYSFEKLEVVKNLIRISSWFLILILFFAVIITLLTTGFASYGINYCVVFLSLFILLVNALTLIVISILYKVKNQEIIHNIQKELILFLASLAGLLLLSAVIHLKY
ncbi:hypothetical protein [Flavobacterium hungaricum]|uniref:Uncharacterized protein n=1 Tax=Flavobacterium hungaricum TaxID=2082725 RepID=A0ABR9TG42_9FLAO|nr:hypothetical protein [Flavobacterium hungaricum]MBE8724002.1 hypothetical protein [Flavobacterium hungaricum]